MKISLSCGTLSPTRPAIAKKNITCDKLSDVYYYDKQYLSPRQPLRDPAGDSGLEDKIDPKAQRSVRHYYY